MKKALTLIVIAGACLLFTSCSHNASLLGIGSAFRIGSGEASVWYGDGLFLNSVSRENVKFQSELDSTMGVNFDPTSGTYKGIKSISLEVGPQLGGYAKELGEKNPEALKSYYDALAKYYEYRAGQEALPASSKSAISDDKSKEATQSVAETLKKAINAAKSIIGKKEEVEGEGATFQCDGNCEYNDLTGNASIDYQLSIALKLLSYNGYAVKMEGSGEWYQTTLEHFITQLIQYRAKGNKTTPLRVKYVTVKDGEIIKLMYIYFNEDGTTFDVECPSCIAM